jgi:SAM-dependent methyltransferase
VDLYATCVKRYRAWVPPPIRELIGTVRTGGAIWQRTQAWHSHVYARGRWDREYRSERWQYMRELPELARYSVLAGYAQYLCPFGRILDLGCGEGILPLRMQGFQYYLGVDISGPAIEQARSRAWENTDYVCADVASFEPPQAFDAIVLNEVLYYIPDAVTVMRRYQRHLTAEGVFLVSMFADPYTEQNWQILEEAFVMVDQTTISNHNTWSCRVLRPRAALADTP